jgi:hypothetical protein
MRTAAGFSPQRLGFKPRAVHEDCVDVAALIRVLSEYFGLRLPIIIPQTLNSLVYQPRLVQLAH